MYTIAQSPMLTSYAQTQQPSYVHEAASSMCTGIDHCVVPNLCTRRRVDALPLSPERTEQRRVARDDAVTMARGRLPVLRGLSATSNVVRKAIVHHRSPSATRWFQSPGRAPKRGSSNSSNRYSAVSESSHRSPYECVGFTLLQEAKSGFWFFSHGGIIVVECWTEHVGFQLVGSEELSVVAFKASSVGSTRAHRGARHDRAQRARCRQGECSRRVAAFGDSNTGRGRHRGARDDRAQARRRCQQGRDPGCRRHRGARDDRAQRRRCRQLSECSRRVAAFVDR